MERITDSKVFVLPALAQSNLTETRCSGGTDIQSVRCQEITRESRKTDSSASTGPLLFV